MKVSHAFLSGSPVPLVDSQEEKRILNFYAVPRWRNLVDALGSGPKDPTKMTVVLPWRKLLTALPLLAPVLGLPDTVLETRAF